MSSLVWQAPGFLPARPARPILAGTVTANGVIASKLDLLATYRERLRALVPSSLADLQANWERQKAVERILQVMIEIVIDVADRLVSLKGRPPAPTAALSLSRLQEVGVIANAERYHPLVRFRNFIVHRYEDVDLSIVYGILTRHLDDFQEFDREVRAYTAGDL